MSSLSHSPETRAGVLLAHTFTSDLDCTRTGLRQGRCGELAAAKPVSSFVRPVALTSSLAQERPTSVGFCGGSTHAGAPLDLLL